MLIKILMAAFNIFANLDDFANEKNHSLSELDSKAAVGISEDTNITAGISPVQTKKRSRRNAVVSSRKEKSANVVDLDDDDDVLEVAAVPGVGQKTAYKRLNALKKSIEATVKPTRSSTTVKQTRSSRSSTMKSSPAATNRQMRTRVYLNDNDVAPIIDVDVIKPQNNQSIEFDDDEFDISLKLKWEGTSKVEKMQFRWDKKFSELITNLSTRENIEAKFFLLMLGDKIINQDDTPRSINYTIGKFIAVRVLDNLLPTYLSKTKEVSKKIDSLEFKIQTPQWKKPKTFNIKKTDTFKILTVIIAEELKCSPEKLRLKFDGDILELSSTPVNEDFEGGEMLDLIFCK